MRLLTNLFAKGDPILLRLPTGSFTVDREGSVVVRTVSSSFPTDLVDGIAEQVVAAFRQAQEAQLPLSELVFNYTSLKITARELRGGAIVFLSPKTPVSPAKTN
jgi:hypothetical protein